MGKGSGKRPHVSRTGEHHTPWTTSDIRYLRENAGHVPVAEIARHLKRSQQAIQRITFSGTAAPLPDLLHGLQSALCSTSVL